MSDNAEPQAARTVLVIGAYGFIGAIVARRLMADGHTVIGLGRNQHTARAVLPGIEWRIHDVARLLEPGDWAPVLASADHVVNCAGALQDGATDDLASVHHRSIAALAAACKAAACGLAQISAVGVDETATTAFFRTKAAGDDAIVTSGAEHWIFRPGLVLGPTAYGGTALLRMLAVFPLIQPVALPHAPIQTVSVNDVAEAVSLAVAGAIPSGTVCDLVEDTPHELQAVIAAHRKWLGIGEPAMQIVAPGWLLRLTSSIADGLGRLGWRSPLRSTALKVLHDGVRGDPAPWRKLTGSGLSALHETLITFPATVEHRQFARMSLLMPIVMAALALFWLVSGLIGLLRVDQAANILAAAGWSAASAKLAVVFWALVDILLAGALMIRRFAAPACWAMVAVSLTYLVAATWTTPHLWADPLGPLVKIIPGLVLALVARIMLETR